MNTELNQKSHIRFRVLYLYLFLLVYGMDVNADTFNSISNGMVSSQTISKVGIGTAAGVLPSQKLTLSIGATAVEYVLGQYAGTGATGNTASFRVGGGLGTTDWAGMEVKQVWNTPVASQTNNKLGFFTANGTTSTEKMTILSNGNVGIGVLVPTAKLDLQDASNNQTTIFNSNLNYGNGITGSYAANKIAAVYGTGSTGVLTGLQVNVSTLGTGATYAATFMGGRVGIGTSTPGAIFDVTGTSNFNGTASFQNALTFAGYGVGADASLWKSAGAGMVMRGVAGTSYDMALMTPAAAYLMRNPTGTQNLEFPGTGKNSFTGVVALGTGTPSYPTKRLTLIGSNFENTALQLENTDVAINGDGRNFNFGITTVSPTEGRLDLTQPGIRTIFSVFKGGQVGFGSTTNGGESFQVAGNARFGGSVSMTSTLGVTGAITNNTQVGIGTRLTTATSTGILGNAAMIDGNYEWTGIHAFQKEIAFSGYGTTGTGKIFRTVADGLAIRGVGGVTNDFSLLSASGGMVMRNPTGTNNLEVAGNTNILGSLGVTGGLTLNGKVGIGGPADANYMLNVVNGSTHSGIKISGSQIPALYFGTTSTNLAQRNWEIVTNNDAFGDLLFRRSTSNNTDPSVNQMAFDPGGNMTLYGNYFAPTTDGYWIGPTGTYNYGMFESSGTLRFRSGSASNFLVVDASGIPTFANQVKMASTLSVAGAINGTGGDLTIGSNTIPYEINLNGPSGQNRGISWKSAGQTRWRMLANGTPETGSNTGSDFAIQSYNDAGAFFATALTINRSNRTVTICDNGVVAGSLSVSGPITMSTNPVFSWLLPTKIPFSSIDGGGIMTSSSLLTYNQTTQTFGTQNGYFAGNVIVSGGVDGLSSVSASGTTGFVSNGVAGTARDVLNLRTGGLNRWIIRNSASPEAGSNTGSSFQLLARADDGSGIDNVIDIARAAGGTMTLARPISIPSTLAVSSDAVFGSKTTIAANGQLTLKEEGIILNRSVGSGYICFQNGGIDKWNLQRDNNDGGMELHANANSGTSGYFRVQNNYNTLVPAFTVDTENGRVAIGKVTPSVALDVVGAAAFSSTVAVTGELTAGSIKTNSWGISPPPDYVFDKGYKLASLENVERFLDKNKHLPEIPSAKEIKRDGLDLGEMNLKLLKKVEELTLYSIAQNKKIEELSNRLSMVEKGRK